MPQLKIYHAGLKKGTIPRYQKFGDAGFDLHSARDVWVKSHSTAIIDTDLIFMIPNGYEMQIRSRSGLSAKFSLFVLNSPGTIDSGYRDTIKIILRNESSLAMNIKVGDRIAQGVIKPVMQAEIIEVDEVDYKDDRGGGLGSTGISKEKEGEV